MGERPTQEMIDEGYKQVKLNARAAALDRAMQARSISTQAVAGQVYTADDLIADAKKIEEYMLAGIEPPQLSSILRVHGSRQ